MYNKEALRKELEDCWNASYEFHVSKGQVDFDRYITIRLEAMPEERDLRRMLEDTWKNGYANGMIITGPPLDVAMTRYITTRLAALDDGQEGKGLDYDPFIQKHLKIIMDKMADANIVSIIEKMWGGLEMASVEYFVQTGKVNGNFHLRLKELMYHFAERWHNTAALPVADGEGEKVGEPIELYTRSQMYQIANNFYGSDHNMDKDTFDNYMNANGNKPFTTQPLLPSAVTGGGKDEKCERCKGDGIIETHVPEYECVTEKYSMIVCPDCEGSGIQP